MNCKLMTMNDQLAASQTSHSSSATNFASEKCMEANCSQDLFAGDNRRSSDDQEILQSSPEDLSGPSEPSKNHSCPRKRSGHDSPPGNDRDNDPAEIKKKKNREYARQSRLRKAQRTESLEEIIKQEQAREQIYKKCITLLYEEKYGHPPNWKRMTWKWYQDEKSNPIELDIYLPRTDTDFQQKLGNSSLGQIEDNTSQVVQVSHQTAAQSSKPENGDTRQCFRPNSDYSMIQRRQHDVSEAQIDQHPHSFQQQLIDTPHNSHSLMPHIQPSAPHVSSVMTTQFVHKNIDRSQTTLSKANHQTQMTHFLKGAPENGHRGTNSRGTKGNIPSSSEVMFIPQNAAPIPHNHHVSSGSNEFDLENISSTLLQTTP